MRVLLAALFICVAFQSFFRCPGVMDASNIQMRHQESAEQLIKKFRMTRLAANVERERIFKVEGRHLEFTGSSPYAVLPLRTSSHPGNKDLFALRVSASDALVVEDGRAQRVRSVAPCGPRASVFIFNGSAELFIIKDLLDAEFLIIPFASKEQSLHDLGCA